MFNNRYLIIAVLVTWGFAPGAAIASQGNENATLPSATLVEPIQRLRWEASFALPQPLQVGVERQDPSRFRKFATAGFFGLPAGGKSFLIYGLQAGVRYFPWKDGFFLALGGGYQRIQASAGLSALEVEGEKLADAAVLRGSSFFILPAVGFVWHHSERWTIASEIGLQVPLYSTGDMYLYRDATGETSDNSETLRVNSRNYISRITAIPLPQISLLRVSHPF